MIVALPGLFFYLFLLLLISVLFHLKLMTNAIILILILLISRFWMATFLVPLLMMLAFLKLFGLQDCLIILLTSVLVTNT